ncbi:MAG: HEAT repeat domain-containing protein [Fodinibius sp.]|nr:HEAT repeat domain-containing protein [Fodinibius sp.]
MTTLASAEQFRSFAESVTQQDSTGHRAIFVIQQLANIGEVEEAVGKAGLFATDEYSYEVRRMALDILIQHDHTPADWLARAKNLLDTADPRVRFLVVKGLARNRNQEVTDFLSSYLQDEYDARVYRQIEQALDM